jgi:hypothetical protein
MADTSAGTSSHPSPAPEPTEDGEVAPPPPEPTALVPPADTEEERIEAENDLA